MNLPQKLNEGKAIPAGKKAAFIAAVCAIADKNNIPFTITDDVLRILL